MLVKALTLFPSPDFSLCLHLLPPNILNSKIASDPLSDAVRKLTNLNALLESGAFREFWATFDSDDLFADLVADVAGFEETMRDAIAVQTNMVAREVKLDVILGWLNVSAEDLKELLVRYGWTQEGDVVKIPINKENEAKTTVFRENVNFGRMYPPCGDLGELASADLGCRVPERCPKSVRAGGLNLLGKGNCGGSGACRVYNGFFLTICGRWKGGAWQFVYGIAVMLVVDSALIKLGPWSLWSQKIHQYVPCLASRRQLPEINRSSKSWADCPFHFGT